jgi:hypothetical protein
MVQAAATFGAALWPGSDSRRRGAAARAAAIARKSILFQKLRRAKDQEESDLADQSVLRRCIAATLAALVFLAAAPAAAAVTITFYSHELGSSFPHAFVTMAGAPDRGGPPLNVDYGFSAKTISPAILWGKVSGEVISDHGAAYIRGSDRHFSLTLSDADYDHVMATIARWRAAPQPSYDLGTHNCVHFVADLARSLGMVADTPKPLMKKPRSYLEHLTAENRPWLAAHHATLWRAPAGQAAPNQPLRVPSS